MDKIKLQIYTPDGNICNEVVSEVTLPGSMGRFTIMVNHAPIISSLEEGTVTFLSKGKSTQMSIAEGFVEGKENSVTVYTESVKHEKATD